MVDLLTAWVHMLLGVGYWLGVGGLSAILAHRLWRHSRSGALVFVGLVWMALSCGPHHGHWGVHLLDHKATGLDTLTVAAALPFGAAWLWWQTAAVFSERALPGAWRGHTLTRIADNWPAWWRPDWTIKGSAPVPAVVGLLIIYCTAIISTSWPNHWTTQVTVQVVLVVLYLVISVLWWRGQIARRDIDGVWSAKGCTLGLIWATCAMSHWSWAVAVGDGQYQPDGHMLAIDAIGIPAAVSFIVLVLWLQRAGSQVPDQRRSGK